MTLTWTEILKDEKEKDYFKQVLAFQNEERKKGKHIYPAPENIFNAFKLTPFENIKVVILGQDPYHGPDQAEGLCFSVPVGVTPPPSLKNIFKELQADLKNEDNLLESGFMIPNHGHLFKWCEQGVFLLNSVLTVEEGRPGSHSNRGWEKFTDAVIQMISEHKEHVVFLLWGNYAKSKAALIDTKKHTVLTAPHPSPLSAHTGFLDCKHFSKTNTDLKAHNLTPINWQI
jgi:uracil-DNA glycosylase